MTEKTEAQKEQARIVAEQEDAQSVPPYPSQAQIDKARMGHGDAKAVAGEPVIEPDKEPVKGAELPDVKKTVDSDKASAHYKTRTAKAD